MAVEIRPSDSGGGSSVILAFLLGVVLVVAGVIGFFMWDNYKSHQGAPAQPGIHITLQKK